MKILQLLKEKKPLIHCIGNDISTQASANLLLAVGARPIMTFAPQEAEEISRQCMATTINCGTPTQEKFDGLLSAVKGRSGHPLIIDPVGVGASQWRKDNIFRILKNANVSVIHCNFSEGLALVQKNTAFEGVDSANGAQERKISVAKAVAEKYSCTVVMTGENDIVTDGSKVNVVCGGSSMMSLVSGSGCMLSALLGAFCAVSENSFDGAVAASVFWKKAAEMAAEDSKTPGSFATALIDSAYLIKPEDMEEITVENYQ